MSAGQEYDVRLLRLLDPELSYETFRSEICHMYHFDGDYHFIRKVMKSDLVMVFWNRNEYAKALYALAMIDYISWKNHVPFFDGFARLRTYQLEKPLYPLEVVMMDKLEHSHKNRDEAAAVCSQDACGAFFFRHNIIERSIEDVV